MSLVVYGPGRVGRSLLAAAGAAGLEATGLGRRDLPAATGLSGAATLLCVPDAAIEEACEQVAAHGPRLVGHVSGATGLAALEAAAAGGADTFSLHPLQTFPGPDTGTEGVPCAVAGSSREALDYATDLGRALGMEPFELPEERRAAYHAAASIASNFLVSLEEAASELLSRAGVDDGRRLLAPLVLATARNWADRGASALTGPVARGDEATVAEQRAAVEEAWPELLEAFDALVALTRLVAETERGTGEGGSP